MAGSSNVGYLGGIEPIALNGSAGVHHDEIPVNDFQREEIQGAWGWAADHLAHLREQLTELVGRGVEAQIADEQLLVDGPVSGSFGRCNGRFVNEKTKWCPSWWGGISWETRPKN